MAEPLVAVDKTANPLLGDAGDLITYTAEFTSVSGDNRSTAFDVAITDNLDPLLVNVAVVSVTPAGDCSDITNNSAGNTIALLVSRMAPGCVITVVYTANLGDAVAPGTSIPNTATVLWTSLPGSNGTASNPTNADAPGASGADQGERNGSGGVNDYQASENAQVNVRAVNLTKTVSSTSQDSTGQGQVRPGIEDLTIGESAVFEIIATIPEGTTPQVIITDVMPFTNGVMELVSASIVSVGANLTTQFSPASPAVPSDGQLGDGINDTAAFNFGQVINTADGVSNELDQIKISVTGLLRDLPSNVSTDQLTNTASVQFGTGLDAIAQAGVDVVAPLMTVIKNGDVSQGDAGDTITYTLTIEHSGASTADAFDVLLDDLLPADLTLVAGSLSHDSGLEPTTLAEAGNGLEASWDIFLLGQSSVLSFQATIDITASPSEVITNTADLGWSSLPGDGDPNDRMSATEDTHSVTITEPGINKVITDTSVPATTADQFGTETDLTIGEVVTYQFTVVFPEGETRNAEARDQLPTGSSILSIVSSRLVTIGQNLSGVGLPALNAPGVASDTNTDTFNDRVVWSLGNVVNTPDGISDANDTLVFEVVAVVVDATVNQSGVLAQTNTASLVADNNEVFGTVAVDLVAPRLQVIKDVISPQGGFVDAGDEVEFRITVEHTNASTADAYSIVITDSLPDPDLLWVETLPSSTCSGLVTDSSNTPLIEFTFAGLSLADDSCTIEFKVLVGTDVEPGEELENLAELQYDSTPVFTTGESRRLTGSDSDAVNVKGPSLLKVAVLTTLDDTHSDQYNPLFRDLAIGEKVTYELTLQVQEGVIADAILTDLLPASDVDGYMRVIGANVEFLGDNIITSLPGTAVIDDFQTIDGINDRVQMDFGTIINVPDNVLNQHDLIIVTVVAEVVDVPENFDGLELINGASFDFNGGSLQDTATVEVVEPELDLTKNMGPVNNGVVRMTLAVENNGTAPAYDILVTDLLDESVWDVGSLNQISISDGFTLAITAGPNPGESTLTFSTDPLAASPAGTIPVDASVTVVFELTLAQLPPVQNPVVNVADLKEADTLPGDDPAARLLPPDQDEAQIGIPDLLVSKDDTLLIDADQNSGASPNDTIRYTLVVNNQGAAAASHVILSDIPDANTSLVVGSVTTSQGSVIVGNTAGDTTIQVDIGSIAVQGSVTITYDVTVNNPLPAGVTELVNQAIVSSDELPDKDSDDPDEPGTEDPTVVPVIAAPDLVISKDDGADESSAGDAVVYTLQYQNVGNQDATGVVISETVPAYSSFNGTSSTAGWVCVPNGTAGAACTLAIGDVAAGEGLASVNFAITIDSPLPAAAEQVYNLASIADDGNNGDDPTPENNSDDDTNVLLGTPDLQISKDDGDASAIPGGIVAYTLSYRNVGNQDATGVVLSDTVPVNTTFAAGSSTVGWICVPDINAGSTCTLDVGAVAAGAAAASASFAVTVDNPLPAGITEVANTASIADDGDNGEDPTPDDNTDNDTTPVNAQPDLVISKDDGGITTVPGSRVAYTLSYQNVGDQDATGVVISETVPANSVFNAGASTAGWTCVPDGSAGSGCSLSIGPLAAGAAAVNAVFAVDVVDPLPAGVDELFNTSSIADDGNNGEDPTPENNIDSDNTPIDATPDLQVTKDDGDVTAEPGDTVTYVLEYQNVGNQDATGVVISETVPDNSSFDAASSTVGWICTPDTSAGSGCSLDIGDVAAGASAVSVNFAVTVDNPLSAGVEQILNSVSIADDGDNGEDPTPEDNTDSDNTPVDAQPDLVISKDDGGIEAVPGQVVVYTLSYQNVGNQNATGVEITETVPDYTTFDAVSSEAGWVCAPDSNAGATCTLAIGEVVAGEPVAEVLFAVAVETPLASGVEEIFNGASIADDGSNGEDPTPEDNSDDDNTPINAQPDLVITKFDTGETMAPGNVLPYTLTYQNVGDQNATGVVITETVPDYTTFEAAGSEAGWVCTPDINAGSSCTLALGEVVAGADPVMVVFAVRLITPWVGGVTEISNTTIIGDDGANGEDPTPENNTDTVVTEVGGAAYFRVTKDFTDDNPMEVDVQLSCNTGLILDQHKLIREGDDVIFVAISFTPGVLNCTVTETIPAGYTPTYEAIDDPEGSAVAVYDDENGCYFEGIDFGAFECRITNTPNQVPIVIEKQWVFNSDASSSIDTRFELTLFCNSEIIDSNEVCHLPPDTPGGAPAPQGWCKYFAGSSDQIFTAEVIPDYPVTHCHVTERVLDPAVEIDNGCQDLQVSAGQGDSCVIVNTVFFEGIPTLNQYGMALLALMMLGMGFVGMRRLI